MSRPRRFTSGLGRRGVKNETAIAGTLGDVVADAIPGRIGRDAITVFARGLFVSHLVVGWDIDQAARANGPKPIWSPGG
jgi:ornithine cyclodeaminase/alanine dehydrogenase-like protein (mu-crystallin family)